MGEGGDESFDFEVAKTDVLDKLDSILDLELEPESAWAFKAIKALVEKGSEAIVQLESVQKPERLESFMKQFLRMSENDLMAEMFGFQHLFNSDSIPHPERLLQVLFFNQLIAMSLAWASILEKKAEAVAVLDKAIARADCTDKVRQILEAAAASIKGFDYAVFSDEHNRNGIGTRRLGSLSPIGAISRAERVALRITTETQGALVKKGVLEVFLSGAFLGNVSKIPVLTSDKAPDETRH